MNDIRWCRGGFVCSPCVVEESVGGGSVCWGERGFQFPSQSEVTFNDSGEINLVSPYMYPSPMYIYDPLVSRS